MRYVFLSWVILLMIKNLYGARPFSTDDAGTVPELRYELEMGYDFGKDQGVFGFSFKHGLTQRMDLGIEFGYNTISLPENCFTPVELCLKYIIFPDLFSVSISNEWGNSSYDLNTIITKAFGLIEFDFNLGYSISGDSGKGITLYAAALIAGFNKLDIGGEIMGNEDKLEMWFVGGRYRLMENLSADIGISGGFGKEIVVNGTFGLHMEF